MKAKLTLKFSLVKRFSFSPVPDDKNHTIQNFSPFLLISNSNQNYENWATHQKITWISRWISEKSKNFFPGKCKNSPYSSSDPSGFCFVCKSCRTSGRRVQTSLPLSKKSRPTMASMMLDLPLPWQPTKATWGSSIMDRQLSHAKTLWSLFTIGITEWLRGTAEGVEDMVSFAIYLPRSEWKPKT